jgi:hypothetical protein
MGKIWTGLFLVHKPLQLVMGILVQSVFWQVHFLLEALIGLLSFAIATGLFFGRFSRPTAFLKFSHNAVLFLRRYCRIDDSVNPLKTLILLMQKLK